MESLVLDTDTEEQNIMGTDFHFFIYNSDCYESVGKKQRRKGFYMMLFLRCRKVKDFHKNYIYFLPRIHE